MNGRHIGLGISHVKTEKHHRYFDKNKHLTFGNGDEMKQLEDTDIDQDDNDEVFSEFLSIFMTMIFFTDPSESNNVIIVNKNKEEYKDVLEELFSDYVFEYNLEKKKSNSIVFTDDIERLQHIEDNYLSMGVFDISRNTDFQDGILLRPIYGKKIRLLVKGNTFRTWNAKNMKKLLCHHTCDMRKKYIFMDPLTGTKEMSYDRAAYQYILSKYLVKINITDGNIDLVKDKTDQIAHLNVPGRGVSPF